MSKFLMIALATILSVSSTFAAEKPVVKTSADGNSSYSTAAYLNLAGSIGMIDGNFAFGPSMQLEWPVVLEGNDMRFGVQTGFYYTRETNENPPATVKTTTSGWAIPILGTAKYHFSREISFVRPYAAIGLGLSIDHASAEVVTSGVKVSRSDTSIHFAMLARPGVTLGNDQQWFVEIPFGVILDNFALLPTVGYHF